jgi:AhpD family alkylhydroperoxidase
MHPRAIRMSEAPGSGPASGGRRGMMDAPAPLHLRAGRDLTWRIRANLGKPSSKALAWGGRGILMPTTTTAKVSIPEDVKREITQAIGFVPSFMTSSVASPETARLFWSMMRDFQLSDKTALDGKTKELIGLGVASQIPCHYCIVFHTEAARLNGATEQEIREAVFMAGMTRFASTVLNGATIDQPTFDKEVREIIGYVKKQMSAGGH